MSKANKNQTNGKKASREELFTMVGSLADSIKAEMSNGREGSTSIIQVSLLCHHISSVSPYYDLITAIILDTTLMVMMISSLLPSQTRYDFDDAYLITVNHT